MEKQIADLNGKMKKKKNIQLSTKKDTRVTKEGWSESVRKGQNVARDYGNGSEHVKGINRGEKVSKWWRWRVSSREKLRQKQEAVERAHAEELEFERKKLELK